MAMMGITLKEGFAARVRNGLPVMDIGAVDGADKLENGRPVRFIEGQGKHVAVGVADPENELLRVWSLEALTSFDPAFYRQRVRTALAWRKSLGLVEPDHAWRLINAEGDGLSGITADVYGAFGVVYVYCKGLTQAGRELAEQMCKEVGLRGVVVKQRSKGASKPGQMKQDVVGQEPPETMVVKELGVPFEVHLLGGLNVGLFGDMREQRRVIHRFAKGRNVLNTFCYTGAISVAAARAGAASVTSLDLSSGVIKWAQENFRLSGLDPADPRWRFEVGDVVRFMEKAHENARTWDMIVLDPPTVSAARTHGWSMRNDYPELIALAMDLMPPDTGGVVWVSANAHGGPGVMKHIENAHTHTKRRAVVMETAGMPPDYPTPVGWQDGRYLEIVHLRVLPN